MFLFVFWLEPQIEHNAALLKLDLQQMLAQIVHHRRPLLWFVMAQGARGRDVRSGSKATYCTAELFVCFAPNSGDRIN
ncbi:MAG TPA: hypothetical protein VFB45_02680 [Pseudolabrys sp.]|nr:hypothetical protein [Pseudolabrys sp.]